MFASSQARIWLTVKVPRLRTSVGRPGSLMLTFTTCWNFPSLPSLTGLNTNNEEEDEEEDEGKTGLGWDHLALSWLM